MYGQKSRSARFDEMSLASISAKFCWRRATYVFLCDLWVMDRGIVQVNVARDVAVQMCDTLEGKAYTGVVNVSYMAVANEVRYG